MKKYTLLIVVVFLCFTMCNKENNNENLYFSDTLISQINSENLAIQGFTYNSNYLIYESMEPYVYKRFLYDTRKTLYKVEMVYSFSALSCVAYPGQSVGQDPRKAAVTQYSEFEYDNALRLTKKSNYFINSGNPELTSYQTYNYENNRIVKTSTFNPQGELIEYHDYKYDERGNITRDDRYTKNPVMKLSKTLIYEFDDKNNLYQVLALEGNPGNYTNRNNIVKETIVSYNGTAESASTKLNVYKYNNFDYPVKINGLDCLYGK